MRVLLLSLGTRGDLEPFLAAGVLLRDRGHEVRAVMPAQFAELVYEAGIEFRPLSHEFLELLDTAAGRGIMGQRGGRLRRLGQLVHLARASARLQRRLVEEQRAATLDFAPDRLLYHPKCFYARLWGMRHPDRAFALSPVPNWLHPTRRYPHIAFPQNWTRLPTGWTYRLANGATALAASRALRRFRDDFPGVDVRFRAMRRHMREREHVLYLVSPTLFPPPPEWPARAQVIGHLERTSGADYDPPPELAAFLERHAGEDVLGVTFGSMVGADPARTTAAILEALAELGVPAVLNTAGGGLVRTAAPAGARVAWVDGVPYDWLLPRVAALVHHGGSGTTNAALRHGCASMIVPHIVDQFFWARRCVDLGVGPAGPPISRLTASSFLAGARALLAEPRYRARAGAIAQGMRGEDAAGGLVAALGVAGS